MADSIRKRKRKEVLGVEKNQEEAVSWYCKAAEEGGSEAANAAIDRLVKNFDM